MANPRGPYLGGPMFRKRQQLRLANPPPGGFAPTPRNLRENAKLRQQEEQAEQHRERELSVFTKVAVAVGFVLVVAIAVLITVAVASH
ncbi:MAG TPA: hypothetical protein VGG16_28720 [Streptosporangiaceae bacterium]